MKLIFFIVYVITFLITVIAVINDQWTKAIFFLLMFFMTNYWMEEENE